MQLLRVQGTRGGGKVSPKLLSMALSEPMGTGLFVGNIVLGASVLMSRRTAREVGCLKVDVIG